MPDGDARTRLWQRPASPGRLRVPSASHLDGRSGPRSPAERRERAGLWAPGPTTDRWPAQPTAARAPRLTSGVRRRGETGRHHHGRRHHATAHRERHALRAPDEALEPQDEALHLHRAQRHLHHRPDPDPGLHRPRLRLRQGDGHPRRDGHVRRHQATGAGADRRAGHAGRHALCHRALAGRDAHQLPDRVRAAPAAQGARAHRGDRRPDGADQEGGAGPVPRAHQAAAHARRHPRDDPHAQRDLDRRHQQGAPRGQRGAQARHPGRRHPRHQLRPRRRGLQDPGQRRRDPLDRHPDPRHRRRRRRGPDGPRRQEQRRRQARR